MFWAALLFIHLILCPDNLAALVAIPETLNLCTKMYMYTIFKILQNVVSFSFTLKFPKQHNCL